MLNGPDFFPIDNISLLISFTDDKFAVLAHMHTDTHTNTQKTHKHTYTHILDVHSDEDEM